MVQYKSNNDGSFGDVAIPANLDNKVSERRASEAAAEAERERARDERETRRRVEQTALAKEELVRLITNGKVNKEQAEFLKSHPEATVAFYGKGRESTTNMLGRRTDHMVNGEIYHPDGDNYIDIGMASLARSGGTPDSIRNAIYEYQGIPSTNAGITRSSSGTPEAPEAPEQPRRRGFFRR